MNAEVKRRSPARETQLPSLLPRLLARASGTQSWCPASRLRVGGAARPHRATRSGLRCNDVTSPTATAASPRDAGHRAFADGFSPECIEAARPQGASGAGNYSFSRPRLAPWPVAVGGSGRRDKGTRAQAPGPRAGPGLRGLSAGVGTPGFKRRSRVGGCLAQRRRLRSAGGRGCAKQAARSLVWILSPACGVPSPRAWCRASRGEAAVAVGEVTSFQRSPERVALGGRAALRVFA